MNWEINAPGSLWEQGTKALRDAAVRLGRLGRGMVMRRRERRMRLRETLALGEKRFLAVVEVDQQEFLVGATGTSIALLARLSPEVHASTEALPLEMLP